MCKLSLNVVPNIYDSLQSSILSLAWPWSGRSLSKGNQWECWDPGLGPNVVGFPVHLPPPISPDIPANPLIPLHPCWPSDAPYTPASGSAGTQCGQAPSPPATQCFLTPLHPWSPLHPYQWECLDPMWSGFQSTCHPNAPRTPTPLLTPWCPYTWHPQYPLHPC